MHERNFASLNTHVCKAFLFVLFLALGATYAAAQVDTGNIVGTVRDPSGAVVPDAKVVVTNLATRAARATQTNSEGQYVVLLIQVGTYSVGVEKTGFQESVESGIKVDVQARLQVDFTLRLGAVTQKVVVTASAPLLDTQSANIGQVVGDRAIADLPLNGRRYDDLVFLTTGVNTVTPVMAVRGEGLFSVDGNTSLQNNFILDGVDNNSYDENMSTRSSQVVVPSVDALSEFKIQTHTYDVSFGRNAGSVINATLKSGSDQFHGDVWEFLRNKAMDANDWFLDKAGKPKAPYQQNQYGGTLGGPIRRNHSFFFINEEHLSIRQGTTLIGSVPTPQMRSASGSYNFSELPLKNGQIPVHTPTLAALNAGGFTGCFTGVTLTSCIDPVGARIFALYPQPNTNLTQDGVANGFVGNNYIASPKLTQDMDTAVARVDTQWHENNKIFGHYAVMDSRRFQPGIFNDVKPSYIDGANSSTYGYNFTRGTTVALVWTRIFSSAIVNEARGGYNRVASQDEQAPFNSSSVSSTLGIQGIPTYPAGEEGGGLATFSMTGFAWLGSPTFLPGAQYSNVYQGEDTLSVIRGLHTLRFGGGWRRDGNRLFDDCCNRGYFNFNGQYTGSALTDLLLGLPQNAGLATRLKPYSYNDSTSAFAQDTWRILPKLTVNYGLRWEYTTPRINNNCQVANFNPTANGGQGGIVVPASGASGAEGCSLVNPWHKGVAPRVGISYQLRDKLAFRGGGGLFFQAIDRQGSESLLELNPPYYLDTRAAIPSTQVPTLFLQNGFPSDTLTPYALTNYTRLKQLSMFRAVDPNLQAAYVENYSAGFEYSITPNLLADVAWVGNFAHHEWTLGNLNQKQITTTGGVTTVTAPYPNFPQVEWKSPIGNANYNALQAKLEERLSKGLSFLLNYTWSKNISDYVTNLEVGAGAGNGHTFNQNWYNRKADKALTVNDQPQRVSFNLSYEVPAGKGHQALSSGLASQILGNWQMNGIYSLASGETLGVISPSDTSQTGVFKVGVTRANCIAKPAFFSGGSVSAWFDTSAFAVPATYQFGTCGNSPGIRSPRTDNLNYSLFKNFTPTTNERFRIQFRAEFFNILNHPQFAPPSNLTVSTAGFGSLTSLLQSPRQIQFALKLFY
jgi:hypothetical protein